MKHKKSAIVQGPCLIIENKELAPRYYRLVFESPSIARAARAGQFVQVGVAGCLLKRPFSVHDVLGSKVVVIYKVVGKGTTALAAVKRGSLLDVIGPLGKPFPLVSSRHRRIFVGGGVGVPPLYFLAKSCSGNRKLDRVFIGGRSKNDLLCVPEFKKLGLSALTATEDGSAGQKGLVTVPFEKYLGSLAEKEKKNSTVFTCGPVPMMKAVAEICLRAGVPCLASLEAVMACGIGVCMGCVVKVKNGSGDDFVHQRVCTEGPVMEAEKIVWE